MSATDPTRLEVSECLVLHSVRHQKEVWSELAKLRELLTMPGGIPMERGLHWNFEFRHAVEDLRSALEYGAYDAYERFVCSSHPAGSVHRGVHFPVADSPTEFTGNMSTTKKDPVWTFRERGTAIEGVFLSAQPFSAPGDPWLRQLHDIWNEGKHRNANYFGSRLRYDPNPDSKSPWPTLVRQELVISQPDRPLQDFFDVATRETGRVISALGNVLYP
jgi:hypothetical protein